MGINGIDSTEQWLRLTALVDDWGMKILLSTMVMVIDRYRRDHVSIKLSITLLLICRLVGGLEFCL